MDLALVGTKAELGVSMGGSRHTGAPDRAAASPVR